MMRMLLAAAAALCVTACGQAGSGPQLPAPPEGAQAPTQLSGGMSRQANLSAEERAQLEGLVAQYLADVQQHYGGGMSPAQGFTDEVAAMQPETDHRWQVNLAGGAAYRFIGACDNECSNLDFEVIDAQGAVVASDLLPDDYPVVDYTPPANGQYYLRLLMRSCSVAPCYAGARVLAASGGESK